MEVFLDIVTAVSCIFAGVLIAGAEKREPELEFAKGLCYAVGGVNLASFLINLSL